MESLKGSNIVAHEKWIDEQDLSYPPAPRVRPDADCGMAPAVGICSTLFRP
jgi:hypothetical protein